MNNILQSHINENDIWKKAENLHKLVKFQNEALYKVPFFISINIWQDTTEIKNEFIKKGIKLVSVRSSSSTEDTEDDSKAWAFKTYLNIDINDIDYYIDDIQSHSMEKFWYKIPVIIQEMIWEWFSWVAFSSDPDSWKDYTVLNYHEWLWEELVSWNISWNVVKIFNWWNDSLIVDALHKKVFNSIKYLKKVLDYEDLDIEFVYSWNILYLLQVRPITKINWWKKETSILVNRYVNFITWILKRRWIILWDMIDINPEELVWKQPLLIKSFFWYIFPETSLKYARKDLWYTDIDNFFSLLLDKTYIDLEKNIISFLPNTLTQEEIDIFLKYYKDLINKSPELQNQLDSILYPNNLEKVREILNWLDLDDNIKKSIIKKFNTFFNELQLKIENLSSKYNEIEQKLLSKAWVSSFYELLTLNNFNWSIDDLLSLIKECTYYFSLFARFFFFLSNNWNLENHDYFKKNIYQSHITRWLISNWKSSINFNLTEWFNFLSLINQTFNSADWNIWKQTEFPVGSIDISKVARENLKFLFMNLFRLLWIKILSELEFKNIDIQSLDFLNFQDLIWFINWEISLEYLNILIKKWRTKKEISDALELPSVINNRNSIIENSAIWNNGFYSWVWAIEWEICFIDKISDFNEKDYKWKIIVIENATPEIDIYLKFIKGIITKNWWPLAHIMIRARELSIPAVVWTSMFDEIINTMPNSLKICFNTESISF